MNRVLTARIEAANAVVKRRGRGHFARSFVRYSGAFCEPFCRPPCLYPMNVHATDHEARLISAKRGDPHALNWLIRQHRQGVYRYGLSVCRTTEDTEDAVQETLWAATRAMQHFRGSASTVVSWLFTIVRRECLRLLEQRRRAPQGFSAGEELADDALDPWSRLAEQERLDLLASALSQLDDTHREVILLRDIQELTTPEAAARLGISIDALKSRLHRARASLRERVIARVGSR